MKFNINKIILWFKYNEVPRVIKFKQNKVNIITGDNSTGKTAIIGIIDYCLLSKRANIPIKVINENIEWYGLNFTIGKNKFTIARGQLTDSGKISKKIFFDERGQIPERPEHNTTVANIKNRLNNSFNLKLKNIYIEGAKADEIKDISFRHFLPFNFLYDNVLTDESNYFSFGKFSDKKIKDYFKIAFDLAIGLEDPNVVMVKKKLQEINKQIENLEKIKNKYLFKVISIGKDAKAFGLIDINIEGFQKIHEAITLLKEFSGGKFTTNLSKLSELKNAELIISRDIRRIKKYKLEYERYKSLQNEDYDSLKPIEYIYNNYNEIIKSTNVLTFIDNLENEFTSIKKEISKMPLLVIETDTDISRLENELKEIQIEIEQFPVQSFDLETDAEKFIYIGRLTERFNENERFKNEKKFEQKILSLINKQKELLPFDSINKHIDKKAVVKDINELIQKRIDKVKILDNYKDYNANFDFDKKTLIYTKSKERLKSNNDYNGLGGSSNYLFIQLAFTLGLHEYFSLPKDIKEAPHVASFFDY